MNMPPTEQAIYDLKNHLRLSAVVDFPDGEDNEDFADDDDDDIQVSPSWNESTQPSSTTAQSLRSSSLTKHRIDTSVIFCFIFYFNLI